MPKFVDFLERVSEALLNYDDLDGALPLSAPTTFTRSARQVEDALARYQEPLRRAVVGPRSTPARAP